MISGALLSSVPKDDNPENMEFCGSTAVVVADSVEDVKRQLSKDVYATSGVWDLDKVSLARKREDLEADDLGSNLPLQVCLPKPLNEEQTKQNSIALPILNKHKMPC